MDAELEPIRTILEEQLIINRKLAESIAELMRQNRQIVGVLTEDQKKALGHMAYENLVESNDVSAIEKSIKSQEKLLKVLK